MGRRTYLRLLRDAYLEAGALGLPVEAATHLAHLARAVGRARLRAEAEVSLGPGAEALRRLQRLQDRIRWVAGVHGFSADVDLTQGLCPVVLRRAGSASIIRFPAAPQAPVRGAPCA